MLSVTYGLLFFVPWEFGQGDYRGSEWYHKNKNQIFKRSANGLKSTILRGRNPTEGFFCKFLKINLVIRDFATQIQDVRTKKLQIFELIENLKGGVTVKNLVSKVNMMLLNAKLKLMEKKEASDQLIVMFIIIAVAAGIAGLLYIFATGTLLPNFQDKINTLIDNWFNHA